MIFESLWWILGCIFRDFVRLLFAVRFHQIFSGKIDENLDGIAGCFYNAAYCLFFSEEFFRILSYIATLKLDGLERLESIVGAFCSEHLSKTFPMKCVKPREIVIEAFQVLEEWRWRCYRKEKVVRKVPIDQVELDQRRSKAVGTYCSFKRAPFEEKSSYGQRGYTGKYRGSEVLHDGGLRRQDTLIASQPQTNIGQSPAL